MNSSAAPLRDILPRQEDDMSRRRYQSLPLHQRKDVKRPYWYVVYRLDVLKSAERPQRSKFLGYCDELSRRKAERLRDAFRVTVNRTDFVLQSQIPFPEFLAVYRKQHVSRLAVTTQAKYEAHLKKHILPEFKNCRLLDIDTEHIDRWLHQKEKEKLSYATRCDLRNILSGIFTAAARWGYWTDRNPVELASAGKKHAVREKRKLTDDQIRKLLAMLPDDVRAIIAVAVFLALRISEILGLQEKHLDFEAGYVRIRQRYCHGDLDSTKTDRSTRDVPMGLLADELRRRCTGDPERFVFGVKTRRGLCRDNRTISQHFLRPVAEALGIYWPGFGFHAFRREAITAIAKTDPMQAMRIAGHTRADTTLLYILDDHEQQERAIQEFQARILGETAGRA